MSEVSSLNPVSFDNLGLTRDSQAETRNKELGQDDFLKLMVTQFQNQDPFKPMENGDFLGQMAQFSTVNGIDDLNSSISTLMTSLQSDQSLQASNLINRTVQLPRESIQHVQGGQISGAVQLADPVQNLTVFVENNAGELVDRINLGQRSAGISEFQWDGLAANGQAAVSGQYRLRAESATPSGNLSVPVLIDAQVDSVSLSSGGQGLQLNLTDGSSTSFFNVQRIK